MSKGTVRRGALRSSLERVSGSGLREVGRRLPAPLVERAVEWYVRLARARGTNVHRYVHDGREYAFEYADFDSFAYLHGCLVDGVTRHERIPLSLFDLPDLDAAIDVGAHFGLYAVILGVRNPGTPVYAFEPDASNAAICRRNLARNGVDGTVVEAAVDAEDGTVTFYEHEDAHNVHTAVRPAETGPYAVRECESASLSTLFERESIEDAFVKVDAEGGELAILEDLLENARYGRLCGLVELHPERLPAPDDVAAVLDLLADHGVDYAPVNGTDRYYVSTFQDASGVVDRAFR